MTQLTRAFFKRDTVQVARDLLGHTLVHEVEGQRVSGRIVETEAYMGWEDRASHAYRRITPRNAVMFGPAGVSYVYLIYGNYWMFNVVARPPEVDYGAAVLIRALEPLEGLEIMAQRRAGRSEREWTSGPGRLSLALGIDKSLSGIDVSSSDSPLYFETGSPLPRKQVRSGPRVGLGDISEPWKSQPWRFWLDGNPFVSK